MSGRYDTPVPTSEIAFENVSFSYGKEKVLNGVSFVAAEGHVTALVGPSGSGKSTISRLAARFWDADSGVVKVGGIDVKTLEPEYLMHKFSFVFQDVTLSQWQGNPCGATDSVWGSAGPYFSWCRYRSY